MAFNLLPVEINEHIACYLPADPDIVSFMLICQATRAATATYRRGLWRDLFARKFDMPQGKTGQTLECEYKIRSRALNRHVVWKIGNAKTETRVLPILHQLVVESYMDLPPCAKAETLSNNLAALRRYVQQSNILSHVLSCLNRDDRTFNPALKTLQLTLTHLLLDPSLSLGTIGFEYSQKAVYEHPAKQPLFRGQNYSKVNIELIMHTVNFFKHHMMNPDAQTLYELYHELEDHERPQPWNSRLQQCPGVAKLGRYWKGSYAYLHNVRDMFKIRSARVRTMSFIDTIDFYDGWQTMELDFSPIANMDPWPNTFESHLKAMPPVDLCNKLDKLGKAEKPEDLSYLDHPPHSLGTIGRAMNYRLPRMSEPDESSTGSDKSAAYTMTTPTQYEEPQRGIHYQQFSGCGVDADRFECDGILHPLPPQDGIPGWQRITMLKYYDMDTDDSAGSHSPLSSEHTGSSKSAGSSANGSSSSSTTSSHSPKSSISSTMSSTNSTDLPPSPTFTPINGNFPTHNSLQDVDLDNSCWAYEGVVLPGGKIILGRWWSLLQDEEDFTCMGPFIFWEVDGDA